MVSGIQNWAFLNWAYLLNALFWFVAHHWWLAGCGARAGGPPHWRRSPRGRWHSRVQVLVRRDGHLCSNLYTASNQFLLTGDYYVSYLLRHLLDYQVCKTGTLGFKRTQGCDPLSPMYSKLLPVQGEDSPPLVIV